ncbi:MAG: phage tail protein, partial [Paraclostridium sp.]
MLKLFNKEHVAVGALTKLKDYKIEYLLSGEDSIEFSLSISDENIHLVEEEGYIQNKLNEYVIKAIDPSQEIKRFSCSINIESIVGKSIQNFDTSNNNINDTIRLAIAGTGWILADNNITKRRTVRLKNTNALEVLREVRKVFRVDFRFDSINKIIHVYEQFGSDKGVYFTDELNLRSLAIPSDTYDYATRLYAYGKDDLTIASINDGKEYVDNFQYSNKVIEYIWEDNRYTDINSLKLDAEAKLAELSKPKRSYQASVADLAKYSEEYNFLDFFLGDTITLLSRTEKFRDKQRIVKYIQYPNNPGSNTCELDNTILTFEDIQKENESKNEIIDNITSDNGTVDGSKVDGIKTEQIYDFEASVAKITDLTVINADIANLKAQNVNITGKLTAIEAEFGTLKSNVAIIDSLTVTHTAQINNLEANKASITQLNAVSATIGTLEAEVGKIQTLVNGNLSSENIQAGGITSDKLTISNGFIKNAMIESLDVSKINAGDISTNKFRIISNDGGIEIVGATQQFKDKNNKVRIQMGKDAQGNFNFIIRGEDGTTTLIDHNGIKQKAIADDLIISNMIASDAVGEKQINYSSFANGFNKDTNTTTLKATKIKLDNQNQSLEVAFNSLKTQSDGTKSLTESHSTTINVMQGQINTAINNTQIVKDGQTILLKDDYNRTVQTVNSMNSTIGSHTTQINQANGKITNVETKVNTVERDLNSITARVSSTETNVTTITTTANNALTKANQGVTDASKAQLTANNANSKIDNLEIGTRNLILNSAPFTATGWSWSGVAGNISIVDESSAPRGKAIKATFTSSGSSGGMHKPPKTRLEVGKKYAWSIWIKASRNMAFSMGHEQGGTTDYNVTTSWQKLSFTFIATDRTYQSFVMYAKNISVNDAYYVHSLKLEDSIKSAMQNEFVKKSRALDTKDGEINSISIMILLENFKEKQLI